MLNDHDDYLANSTIKLMKPFQVGDHSILDLHNLYPYIFMLSKDTLLMYRLDDEGPLFISSVSFDSQVSSFCICETEKRIFVGGGEKRNTFVCKFEESSLLLECILELSSCQLVSGHGLIFFHSSKGEFGSLDPNTFAVSSYWSNSVFEVTYITCSDRLVIIGTNANKIILFDPISNAIMHEIVYMNRKSACKLARITCMTMYDYALNVLAVGDCNGDVCLYNLDQPDMLPIETFSFSEEDGVFVRSILASSERQLVVIDGRGNVNLIHNDSIIRIVESAFRFYADITCGSVVNPNTVVLAGRSGSVQLVITQ